MSLYTQFAEIPVPLSAQFISPHNAEPTVVQVTYSVKEHVKNTKRTMSKSIAFNHTSKPLTTLLQDIDIVAQTTSLSGRKTATLRNVKGSGGETSRVVEVWNLGQLEVSLNVTEHHGDFYTDDFVGSLAFSPSEASILYTAEGNLPETKDAYQKFRFNPDFGEGFGGKRRPTTFVLRWQALSDAVSTSRVSLAILKTPDNVRFGQAIFSADSNETLYATGYEFTQDGRILGIKGCFNRPAGIWRLHVPALENLEYSEKTTPAAVNVAAAHKLTAAHFSCRSPRILRADGGKSTLLWLSHITGGAHLSASTLCSLDLALGDADDAPPSGSARTLVGVVDVPQANGFPGLYPAYGLVPSFAMHDSILVASQWGSRTTVIRISADGGAVQELTPSDNNLYSWAVLTTDGHNRVVCSRSALGVPPEIVLGTLDATGGVTWTVIDRPALPEVVSKALSTIRTSIVQIPGRPLVETLLVQGEAARGTGAPPPCITSPHGGPHGTSSTAFSPSTAALVVEGYTISFPNYSGSPGYGEAFLQALIGRCGELDVQDCIAAARHLVSIGISEEGPGRQFVMGGSHGGFLTAHLIGQFPAFFSAAVLRNPVISGGDITNTDIPDWYFAEFGRAYPLASSEPGAYPPANNTLPPPPLLDAVAFSELQAASPISHVGAMTVPVLLLIGTSDRRVAPSQGIGLYHALKARYASLRPNGRVEMLVFEGEGHPLDGVEASRVGYEAGRDWLAAARA